MSNCNVAWRTAVTLTPGPSPMHGRGEQTSGVREVLEQDVVFQVDMLHQVLAQCAQAEIQGAPRVAGGPGQRDVVGQRGDALQRLAMVVVLVTFLPILAAYYLTRDGDQIAGAGK